MSIIEFPILIVPGEKGKPGTDGKHGTALIYDNTPAVSVSTISTSWETLMSKTGIAVLALEKSKLEITAIFNTTDITTSDKYARIRINSAIVGNSLSYLCKFNKGVNQIKMSVIASKVSSVKLHLDVEWRSFSSLNIATKCFTEFVTVLSTSSLNFQAQANSNVIGDIRCEQLSIVEKLSGTTVAGTVITVIPESHHITHEIDGADEVDLDGGSY